jgi:hypothetical protein
MRFVVEVIIIGGGLPDFLEASFSDTWQYCNGFDQRVARQQLCEYGP